MPNQTTKRKRGAQPGNLNALKHGFYSRQFRRTEHEDLEALLTVGLDSEISMLRVITRRVLEMADDPQDYDTSVKLLMVLGLAATRLARLLSIQSRLGHGSEDEMIQDIKHLLAEINQEICKP